MTVALDLFWLVFAHTLADFGFQNRWMADNKGSFKWLMSAHCIIYTGIMMLMFVLLGKDFPILIPLLFISHYVVDTLKCHEVKVLRSQKAPEYKFSHAVVVDQIAHVVLIVMLYFAPLL